MSEEVNERVTWGERSAIKPIDEEIAELVAVIREGQERLAEAQAEIQPVIDAARERLAMLLEYRGENWSDAEGYARLVSQGVRTSYDSEALDRLILEDPQRYGWLQQYRQETPVRGGVRVK
jgi:hypothetical protein